MLHRLPPRRQCQTTPSCLRTFRVLRTSLPSMAVTLKIWEAALEGNVPGLRDFSACGPHYSVCTVTLDLV